jgi:hypothetical protein
LMICEWIVRASGKAPLLSVRSRMTMARRQQSIIKLRQEGYGMGREE